MPVTIAKITCGGTHSTSRPTVSCASAPHTSTAVAIPPTSTSGRSLRPAFIDNFRQRDGEHVEGQACAQRDHDKQPEQHECKPRRQRHRRCGLARLGMVTVVGREPEIE